MADGAPLIPRLPGISESRHLLAAARLVAVQVLLVTPVLFLGPNPLVVGIVLAWATARWHAWALAGHDRSLPIVGGLVLRASPAMLVLTLLTAWVGGLVAGAMGLLGVFVGLIAGPTLRYLAPAVESDTVEAWSRDHREEFKGVGKRDLEIRPTYDPYGGMLAAPPVSKAPEQGDPWAAAAGTDHQVLVDGGEE